MTKEIITQNRRDKNKRGNTIGCLFLLIIIAIVGGCSSMISQKSESNTPKVESSQSVELSPNKEKSLEVELSPNKEKSLELTKNTGWEKEVKRISSNKSSSTDEKYGEVMKLVEKNYMRQETNGFTEGIANSYVNNEYLNDPKNDEYMLSLIYQSACIDKQGAVVMKANSGDRKLEAFYNFTFDYYQNLKYVYRGYSDKNSSGVKANEQQMEKTMKIMME